MIPVFSAASLRKTGPLKVKDRRGAHRYDLKVAVRCRAPETNLASAWKSGRTLNMSASGVRIEIAETVASGTMLELAMDWTGLYHSKPAVRLLLTGQVVRVDEGSIALRIVSHQFRDVSHAGSRPRGQERTLAVAS
jgi:hypothetical protein